MNNNTCGMVSVSLFACASQSEVSWVRLEKHISDCMKAQKEDELWDGEDTFRAEEDEEFIVKQSLRIPECEITKGWSKQVCQNKKYGSGLCKPRWFAVKIRHYEFGDALAKLGCPMSHDKRYAMVYTPNKGEAKATIENLAKEIHYRVWEGTDCNDDFAYKLAIKPKYL